jgi:hypothetical protein
MRDINYPCTPESIERAKAAADAERRANGIELGPDGHIVLKVQTSVRPLPILEQYRRCEAIAVVIDAVRTYGPDHVWECPHMAALVAEFGTEQVQRWLRVQIREYRRVS